ncbi:MAG: hypothetical protein ACON5C_02625 [Alphaproteobacteria bacterium]
MCFLDHETERVLIAKVQTENCQKSLGKLLLAFEKFLISSIRKNRRSGSVEREDLLQEARLVLIETVYRFDLMRTYDGKPLRFATYLAFRLRHGIQKCIEDHGSTIKQITRNARTKAPDVVSIHEPIDPHNTLVDVLPDIQATPDQQYLNKDGRRQTRKLVKQLAGAISAEHWKQLKCWAQHPNPYVNPDSRTKKALREGRRVLQSIR